MQLVVHAVPYRPRHIVEKLNESDSEVEDKIEEVIS